MPNISDKDKLLMKGIMDLKKQGGYKAIEKGKAISDADVKKLDAMLKDAKIQSKAMGGEVIDMTKSQPVGMMDGGKVKKMNMGGVVPGRGGKFKGMK